MTIDVAIIGAGLTGLVCGQVLQHAGYQVVLLDKSWGVGGRVATRRIAQTCADHGLRCLTEQGQWSQQLIQQGLTRGTLIPWTDPSAVIDSQGNVQADLAAQACYTAIAGINSIAKTLAQGLTIQRDHRVEAIARLPDQSWHLSLVNSQGDSLPSLQAQAVVIAIPAPQIEPLLEPLLAVGLESELMTQLKTVEYDACMTAIATYTHPLELEPWGAVQWEPPAPLSWLTLEQTKRNTADPVIVLQSTDTFALAHWDAPDLADVGQQMVAIAAQSFPSLAHPTTLQVHRWRYAVPRRSLGLSALVSQTLPRLVCGGDWCSSGTIEGALESGMAIAERLNQQFHNRPLQPTAWLDSPWNL